MPSFPKVAAVSMRTVRLTGQRTPANVPLMLQAVAAATRSLATEPRRVYFGDSVSCLVSDEDTDRRSLADLVSDAVGCDVAIAYPGFHQGVLLDLFRAAGGLAAGSSLVCTINLRSFSPQWYAHPSFSHGWLRRRLRDAPRAKDLETKDPGADELGTWPNPEYEAEAVRGSLTSIATVGEYLRACERARPARAAAPDLLLPLIDVHYGHRPIEATPAWCDLVELSDDLARQDVDASFLLLPVNIDFIQAVAGDRGTDLVSGVEASVMHALEPFRCRSCVRDVRPEGFFHANETTEHLNERGRAVVANATLDLLGRPARRFGTAAKDAEVPGR